MAKNIYRRHDSRDQDEVLAAVEANNIELLRTMVMDVALYEPEFEFVQSLCRQLSSHPDEFVRGNAIVGLGHLARRARRLDDFCKPLIEQALQDSSQFVRGQGWTAVEDVSHFLGWSLKTT